MRSTTLALIYPLLAISLLSGCSSPPSAQTMDSAITAQSAPAEEAQAPGARVAGTIAEAIDAAPYTYVRVETGNETIWVAATQFDAVVGKRVVVPLDMPMADFHSKALNRDFALIYFTEALLEEGEAGQMALPPGHPPMGRTGRDTPAANVAMPAPAADVVRIETIWADRETLSGRTVKVQGRVVKVNNGILGQNWLHLQDGSGSEAAGTHDLTVTSDQTASVGDIVTVTGLVEVDKDFGAGYAYKVILSRASVAR